MVKVLTFAVAFVVISWGDALSRLVATKAVDELDLFGNSGWPPYLSFVDLLA
jgi:hypothetical protein